LTTANIGDSVAVLLKKSGAHLKLTQDHVPSRPDEYNRIVGNNGFVTTKNNISRVDGNLAVSRAIGDIQYKSHVISVPEVETRDLDSEDDLLLLSTDGLFSVFSQDQIAGAVHQLRKEGVPLKEIARRVTDECCASPLCQDNVTLILVDLARHVELASASIAKSAGLFATDLTTPSQKRHQSLARIYQHTN
jgi:serine/threonine protein phosphatase PrpC